MLSLKRRWLRKLPYLSVNLVLVGNFFGDVQQLHKKTVFKDVLRQNFGKEHEGWFPKDLDSKMVLVHGKVIGEVSRISSAIVNYFIADERHVRSCLMYESRFSFDEAFSVGKDFDTVPA